MSIFGKLFGKRGNQRRRNITLPKRESRQDETGGKTPTSKPEANAVRVTHASKKLASTMPTHSPDPVLDPLLDQLHSSNMDVWDAAMTSLTNIGEKAVTRLTDKLSEDDWRVRVRAVKVLGNIAVAETVDPLINALSDPHPTVRSGAVEALGKIGDKRAIEPLKPLLHDHEEFIRNWSKGVLQRLGYVENVEKVESIKTSLITIDEARNMTHQQLISHLRAIAQSAMNPSSAPSHLDSYEKRLNTACAIGEVLNERGGSSLMRKALQEDLGWMPGCRTIEQYWDGIGDWSG